MTECTSPVWPPRRHVEEAYGWFSQTFAESRGCTPLVYETTDGNEVLAFGLCSTPDRAADTTMCKDKVCVGLVNTRTAKRSSLRGYEACSSWVWENRAVVSGDPPRYGAEKWRGRSCAGRRDRKRTPAGCWY